MEIKDKELHRIAPTAIVYREDGKFLITQRSLAKKSFPGKWTVPGGGLSVDDYMHDEPTTAAGQWYGALEKTVRREVLEETGIEIEKPQYLLDLTFILPNGIPVLVISYYAKYKSGDIVLDEDTINHAWVTADEAKTYDMIEGIAEEIEMVHDILNK